MIPDYTDFSSELAANIREAAAGWLAAGLDPEQVILYRQSSVPETFELTTMLMAFTSKGLMNRAHAYKAAVQENLEKQDDPDAGINMGLFTYPVLMAADIILFDWKKGYIPRSLLLGSSFRCGSCRKGSGSAHRNGSGHSCNSWLHFSFEKTPLAFKPSFPCMIQNKRP